MKQLLVDCGGSHSRWCLMARTGEGLPFETQCEVQLPGMNFSRCDAPALEAWLEAVRLALGNEACESVELLHFYGAGLMDSGALEAPMGATFPHAQMHFASDLLAAARGLFGSKAGIVAILGTGASTCQWDGEKIVRKIPAGGFILGDEGSGAALGKRFLADFLKGLVPPQLSLSLSRQFPSDYAQIVADVYRGDAPGRYLGSFVPLLLPLYAENPYIRKLVDENFRAFFERTVTRYDTSLPVGVVGGYGFQCKDILQQMGEAYGVRLVRFLKDPMEGLKAYHNGMGR